MDIKTLKVAAATAGTAGVLAMGAVGAAFSAGAEPPAPGPVDPPAITTGETATEKVPVTSSVAPAIEGPASLAPEQEDAL